jgi:membrane protease YdiL (CAAX protease family)
LEHTDFSQLPPLSQSIPALPLPPLPRGHPSQAGAFGIYEVHPKKPAVWLVFVVCILALVGALAVSYLVTVLYGIFLAHTNGSAQFQSWQDAVSDIANDPARMLPFMLLVLMASQIGFLVVTLAAAWLSPLGIRRRLGLIPSTLPWMGYLTLPIGIFSVSVLFQTVARFFPKPKEGTLDVLQQMISQLTPVQLVTALVVVGITPGIAEEFLFRGYVQTRLAARWGRWVAIPIAAMLFGLAHFDPVQSPATFCMGLYLGYVASRSGSIRPAMFTHMVNNSVVVIASWMASRGTSSAVAAATAALDRASLGATLIQVLIAGALLTLCCMYLHYRVHPPEIDQAESAGDQMNFAAFQVQQ